jgi:maltoporin
MRQKQGSMRRFVQGVAPLLLTIVFASAAFAQNVKEIPIKEEAKKKPAKKTRIEKLLEGLLFGSYGRIAFSSDLNEGSRGKSVNVVSRGPRLEEAPYAEINLGYRFERDNGMAFQFLFTLALGDDVFHYNGKFDAKLAIRNLYLQVDNVFTKKLSIWGGSRMYRGDDIYLLDFWPLDDLNTLGGGLRYQVAKRTYLQLHAGVVRIEDPYQYQILEVPNARKVAAEEVELLDRQRTIMSFKGTHEIFDVTKWLSMKIIGYGELHFLPKGTRQEQGEIARELLPADFGWVVGGQLGFWGFGPNSYANLFFRFAGGLGAYDELEIPSGLDLQKKTTDAREVRIGLSANIQRGMIGVLSGGYIRYFNDADGIKNDYDDGWEYVLSLRPMLFFTRHFHQLFEASIQGRRPNGLHPKTQTHLVPTVFKFSVMPALTWDKGAYSRPQIRLVYTVSYLDQGARRLFDEEDPRYGRAVHHYLGLQVEWWYNSAYR